MLPRGVRYEGHVHEQPKHALPVQRLATVLAHDGYRADALKAKAGRNADLLARALAQAPDDAYLHYQIGKDHDVYERYADACAHFARSRACEDASGATVTLAGTTPGWHHDRLVREIHALKKCRQHAQAVLLAENAMAAWSHSPDFFFALGDLLLDWATEEPTRAGELLPMIESAWLRCLEIGERPDLEGSVAGRGSALAARNLACCTKAPAGRSRRCASASITSGRRNWASIGALFVLLRRRRLATLTGRLATCRAGRPGATR